MSLSPLGEAALTYAGGWGWAVFPLRPYAKVPATRRGFHDATTDTLAVMDVWQRNPLANVGIATGAVSGLVVIDVDPGGDATIMELVAALGPLPPTLVALTPRGAHAYFKHPGVNIRCSAGRLGGGVDVRADGGYVVAPPSSLVRAQYRWRLTPDRSEPIPRDLAAVPESWVEVLRTRPVKTNSDDWSQNYIDSAYRNELHNVTHSANGSRNETLNRAAFALGRFTVAGRLVEEEVVNRLLHAALAAGLDEHEARRTIRSALDARRGG